MYHAPVEEILFTLKLVAGRSRSDVHDGSGDLPYGLTDDLAHAILAEAGRFARDHITPLAAVGDRQGARFSEGAVTMPDGWRDLYRRWVEGGWNSLADPIEYGGQGLPTLLAAATTEIWSACSVAFAIGPTLTMAGAAALHAHGTQQLKERYLSRLVSGEWMGTMNLTEPQSGSDLSAIRTRAEREQDGTYRIFGQKIFITYGEHDLTDNIVHLVLARLPDAPQGTRGLSLFLVPKFLVGDDGSLGRRNDVICASIEHKLGIHASPTCTMIYGDGSVAGEPPGAIGWLVGEEHRGLACMFAMMNKVRLTVGVQGVAVADAATQMARGYAQQRLQGRSAGDDPQAMGAIVQHPDVRRTLLTMQALTQAARCIAYACAHALDMARVTEDPHWNDRSALLTPVAKAFGSDIGVEVASLGIQVHGGMGYIEETGASVLLRDARIGPIYEGTNGIQAIDLVTRKLFLSGGTALLGYIGELRADVEAFRAMDPEGCGAVAGRLSQALYELEFTAKFLRQAIEEGHRDMALAGATPFLRLFALAAGGAYLARACIVDRTAARIGLCRYYAAELTIQAMALSSSIRESAEVINTAPAA